MTTADTERVNKIKNALKVYPDFPKPGILFQDIFPITQDPEVFEDLNNLLTEHIQQNFKKVDVIVGLESRGFIFGPILAQKLGVSFVPIRKKGKLPGECYSAAYSLEYGKDAMEMQKSALSEGQKVIVVDDLLATGGTMKAAVELLSATKAEILECMVVIELSDLKGRDKVPKNCWSLINF